MEPLVTPSTNSEYSIRSGATSAAKTYSVLTSYTERNFGRNFLKCKNYKVNNLQTHLQCIFYVEYFEHMCWACVVDLGVFYNMFNFLISS
jgi:hypothetical protein